MDILQRYQELNKECQPAIALPHAAPLIRLVMRLSGGKIRSVHHANSILLGVAMVIFLVSVGLAISSFTGSSLPSPEEHMKSHRFPVPKNFDLQ